MKLSLKKLRVSLFLVAVIAVFCGSQSFAADSSSQRTETVKVSGTCNYDYAYEVLDLVNKERASEGLSSLKMDKDLLEAAMQRAAEISIYFSHTRPSGDSCFTVSSKVTRENVAAGQATPSSVVNDWMSDSGHRAPIMSSSNQSIGIGCFTQGGIVYWVQDFGTSSADTVSKPSNAKKTFSVTLDPDMFSLRLSNEYGGELPIGKSSDLIVSILNSAMGTYTQLEPSSFTFSSSKTSVLSINSSGVMKGLKLGIHYHGQKQERLFVLFRQSGSDKRSFH